MHCCQIVNGIKNKNIKNSLGATWNASHLAVRLCALRHWKQVSMSPTTQSLRHPLTRAIHIAPRIKTARRFTAKNPDDNMISCKEVVCQISPNDFAWYGRDTSHPHQMVNFQYIITIMGGREVSRPYRVWFFAERLFCMFFVSVPPAFID